MTRNKATNQSLFLILLICAELLSLQTALAIEKTEKSGELAHILILAAGLGSAIYYEDGSEGVSQFAKSFVASQLVTEALKRGTHKRRPSGACCSSFPSGHASKAFMGAGFIHKRYGTKYAVPAYIAASYVAYSRVYADQHYVKDVVAGAAIGILSSFYFTNQYQGFELTPVASTGVVGFSISRDW